MVRFQLAYRHANGEIEGFVGYGSNRATARENAIAAVRDKCECSPLIPAFDPWRLIETVTGMTSAELQLVREDWKLERGEGGLDAVR